MTTQKQQITLSGEGLTIESMVKVARRGHAVAISTDAAVQQRVQASADFILKAVADGISPRSLAARTMARAAFWPGCSDRICLAFSRAAWGMTLAHLGLGIAIFGMVGASLACALTMPAKSCAARMPTVPEAPAQPA